MKEMTFDAKPSNLPNVLSFVNTELKGLGCSGRVLAEIDIAIDELFSNIAFYAYRPDTGPATVQVEVAEEPLSVLITFLDNGKPFNPLLKKDPDVTLPLHERKIGGLGIFLVKKTMDSVSYEYRDGTNILRIQKKL